MAFFPSVKDQDMLADVFSHFNTGVEKPLLQMHQVLMRREDSPLPVSTREMIAAYVSGVNSCDYCIGIHTRVAEQFGLEEGLVEELLKDIETADIDENIKPILRFVRKLSLHPARMVQADADEVFKAGWSEEVLYEAIFICCTWNFMNRLVEGINLKADGAHILQSAARLRKGYDEIIGKYNLK